MSKYIFIFVLAIGIICGLNIIPENSSLSNMPTRMPAATEADLDCKDIVKNIVIKKLDINPDIIKGAVKKFWVKHNKTYIGGIQYTLARDVAKRLKIIFMDINKNFRPIYYIQTDDASYAKIFKYFDLHTKGDTEEIKKLGDEINQWIAKYNNFDDEMTHLVSEFVVNSEYIKQLKTLKQDKSLEYPLSIELVLQRDGKDEILRDYIEEEREFNNLIFKLEGKNKKIHGSFFRGPGLITEKNIEQAILRERLKYLESEIRDFIANNPTMEEAFREMLETLTKVNRNKNLRPTLGSATKLEFKELNAEYKDLFVATEGGIKKINEQAQAIIEKLSPRYRQKLGIDNAKEWVEALKRGRKGIIITGLGSAGGGIMGLAYTFWNYINYDDDSKFNIINAKTESEFSKNLQTYLKAKFGMDLLMRLEKKGTTEMTLKDYDPSRRKEKDLVETVNEIITQRKIYKQDEKSLEEIQKKVSETLGMVQTTASGKAPIVKPIRRREVEKEDKEEEKEVKEDEVKDDKEVKETETPKDGEVKRTRLIPRPRPRDE